MYVFQLGIMGANCYIIETSEGECTAIDIGGNAPELIDFLNKKKTVLTKILITHGHYDHIGGIEDVRAATGAEVFVHKNDAAKLCSADESLATLLNPRAFKTVKEYTVIEDGEIIRSGLAEFEVMHTPGHTSGSVCYICGDNIFTGDTLFCENIGRTDFPDSDAADMRKTLKKLASLDKNLQVFPGHDEPSTIGHECLHNPYLKNAE